MFSLVIKKKFKMLTMLRCWANFLKKVIHESSNVFFSTNFGLIIHFEFTFMRDFQLVQVSF